LHHVNEDINYHNYARPRTAGFWMCERFEAGVLAIKIPRSSTPDGSGRGQGCSEAEHDARREAKIILRDSENVSEQPVSLHSPSHSFDQLVIKPTPNVFGK
jgi:hypothetical protein